MKENADSQQNTAPLTACVRQKMAESSRSYPSSLGWRLFHLLGREERHYCAPNLACSDELDDGVDIRVHDAVLVPWGHVLANESVHGLQSGGGPCRAEELDGLASGQDLYGDNNLHVPHHFQRFACREAAHGHVILLGGGSADRVHGCGMSKDLVL